MTCPPETTYTINATASPPRRTMSVNGTHGYYRAAWALHLDQERVALAAA
jgi:hypothetical protein